jgi:hypothetical protein
MDDVTFVRIYPAEQQGDAVNAMNADAAELALRGYRPTSQVWAPPERGFASWIQGTVAVITRLSARPAQWTPFPDTPTGTLTVAYAASDEAAVRAAPGPCVDPAARPSEDDGLSPDTRWLITVGGGTFISIALLWILLTSGTEDAWRGLVVLFGGPFAGTFFLGKLTGVHGAGRWAAAFVLVTALSLLVILVLVA